MTTILTTDAADQARAAIYAIVRQVRRSETTSRIMGEPNDTGWARRALAEIITDARAALREIEGYDRGSHARRVRGNDGRA